MTNHSLYYLKKLKRKYLGIRSGEIILLALAVTFLVFGLTIMIRFSKPFRTFLPGFTGILVFVGAFFRLKLHKLDETRVITFINHQYPVMQQSTDLLIKDSVGLTSLEKIQKEKIRVQFAELYPIIRFPNQAGKAFIFFLTSLILTFIMFSFTHTDQSGPQKNGESVSTPDKNNSFRPGGLVKEIELSVSPPAYTRLNSFTTKNPNLTLPEGSTVIWSILFTDTIQHAQLAFTKGDSVKLTEEELRYTAKKSFTESSIYQLLWNSLQGKSKYSDFFKIETIHDQPPEINISHLQPFTEIDFSKKQFVNVSADLVDDYGLKEAYMIATVSKGSGESVKFREEKLFFTSSQKIQGRNAEVSRKIDLLKLGLEPGDELYYYIEALDNKTPTANRTRTETFFIALQDTAAQNLSVDAGPGINLMPEYFRSQRQIIIDSEKLLRERETINKQVFNAGSNALGYDQKILRLKYGTFLGEEFETAIGPGDEIPAENANDLNEDKEHDPVKQYAHIHDKDNEHNLVPEKSQPDTRHDHGIISDPEKKEDLTDAYKHVHDDPEEATFFTQSIRSKLKAALNLMWDAELHLRMLDPGKSLPYQYKALKLLKEISNESRMYVRRTGFDPPPLKEEKRLSGDLSAIKSSRAQHELKREKIYPAIRYAYAMVEAKLQSSDISLSTKDKQVLNLAGRELAALAIEEPGNYLQALSQIKSLHEDELHQKEIRNSLLYIRKVLWHALPKEKVSPAKSIQSVHPLDRAFIQNLESLKNE